MRLFPISRGILIAMVLSLGARAHLEADTVTWDGSSFNNEWANGLNWSGGNASADDDLIFPAAASQKANHNGFTQNTQFHSIAINGADYAITGETIFLVAGFVANYSQVGATVEFTPNILLTANQAFSGVARPFKLNGVINLNGHTLTSGGVGGIIYDGFLSGSGTLVVTGPVTINGASSALGTTNLNGGTLSGSGTVGAITVNNTNGGSIAPGIPGTSAVFTADGDVTLNNLTTLKIGLGGTVAGNQHDQLKVMDHNIDLNGATLSVLLNGAFFPVVGQQFIIVSQTGAGVIGASQFARGTSTRGGGGFYTISYTASSVTLTYAGTDLTWDGSSNNAWSNADNWNFNVVPDDSIGLIFPAGASHLINSDDITFLNDTLEVAGIKFTGGGYSITGNPINNSIDLFLGITNTAPSGGAITFGPRIRALSNLTLLNTGQSETLNGQLDMNGFGLTVDGTVLQTLSGNVIGTAALGFGGITKNGTGTLRLTGNNSYTGRTIINAGTLEIDNAGTLGDTAGALDDTVVNSGATLRLISNLVAPLPETIGLSGAGDGGAGALTESGCTSNCDISGGVRLDGSSTINVPTSGHKLTLLLFTGTGSFGLTKIGAGTLVLENSSNPIQTSYTGTITVNTGTLLAFTNTPNAPVVVTGGTLGGGGTIGGINCAGGGTIAPGASAGQLNVNGAVTLASTSNLVFEIGGTGQGTTYDFLNKIDNGVLTLNGVLHLKLVNGFIPQSSDTFTIVATQQILQGAFANVPNGGRLNVEGLPPHSIASFKVTHNVINDPVLSRNVTLSDFQTPTPPPRATPKPTVSPVPPATPRPSSTPKS